MTSIDEVKMGGDLPPLCTTEDGEWVDVQIDLQSFNQVAVEDSDWKTVTTAEYGIDSMAVEIEIYEIPFWALKPLAELVKGNRRLARQKKAATLEYRRTTFLQDVRLLNKAEWRYD